MRQMAKDERNAKWFKFPAAALLLLAAPVWGATLEVTQRAAIVGIWGAEVVSEGNGNPAAVMTNMGALQNELALEWSMRVDDATASPGLDMDIVTVRDATEVDLFSVRLRENSGTFEVYAMALDGGTEVTTPATPLAGTARVMVRWVRDPTGGSVELLIDALLMAEVTGLNTDYDTRNTYFGAPDGALNLGGWLALDQFGMADGMGGTGVMATMWSAAMDPEEGDICDSVSWSSDVDGMLGAGCGPFMVALSGGPHAITATATSGTGQVVSKTNNVTVQVEDGEPTIDILEPADGMVIQ